MMARVFNVFGPTLATLRAQLRSRNYGMHRPATQADMARIAGLSRGMIAAAETGRKLIRRSALQKILDHYGLSWRRGLETTWSTHHGEDYCRVRPDTEIQIVYRDSGETFLQGVIEQTPHGTWRLSPTSDENGE